MELFDLKVDQLNSSLVYQSVDSWDSVGHMELITRLESEFNIMMDMDDVIDFSSYTKGKEILAKYDLKIE
jgi:acyl carrier protein